MPQKRHQHFVPQMYMRKFSPDDRSIGLYNLHSGAWTTQASIKDQAWRPYLYGKDLETENKLAKLEGVTDNILKEVISSGRPPPRFSDAFYTMVMFVIAQEFRTVEAAAYQNEMASKLCKHILKRELKASELLEMLPDITLELTDPFERMLSHVVEMSPIVHDLKLKLIRNRSGVPFITSDHPVVLHNQLYQNNPERRPLGLACEGLQIILPISAELALIFYDPGAYRVGRIGSDIVHITAAKEAENMNGLQWMRASQNILFPPGVDVDQLRASAAVYMPIRNEQRVELSSQVFMTPGGRRAELVSTDRSPQKTTLALSAIHTRTSPKPLHPFTGFPVRNETWVEKVIGLADALKNGRISFNEFVVATRRP